VAQIYVNGVGDSDGKIFIAFYDFLSVKNKCTFPNTYLEQLLVCYFSKLRVHSLTSNIEKKDPNIQNITVFFRFF
jgi:hypothetical protein